jgi:hypothetical protein
MTRWESLLSDVRSFDTLLRSNPRLIDRAFPFGLWLEWKGEVERRLPYGDPLTSQKAAKQLQRWRLLHRNFTVPLVSWDGGRTFAPASEDYDRVGSWQGFFATGPEVLDYLHRIDGDVDALDRTMHADKDRWDGAPKDFTANWTSFREEWKAFLEAHKEVKFFSLTSPMSVYDNATTYEKQLQSWRQQWAGLGGKATTPPLPQGDRGLPTPSLEDTTKLASAGMNLTTKVLLAVALGAGAVYLARR